MHIYRCYIYIYEYYIYIYRCYMVILQDPPYHMHIYNITYIYMNITYMYI